MPSAAAATRRPTVGGTSTTGCGAKPSQPRRAVTISDSVCTCGCATSQRTLAGAVGPTQNATVAATSSMRDHLDAAAAADDRRHPRHRGEAAQHGGAAIDRRCQHQRRAQDHPIEIDRRAEMRLGLRLGAGERSRSRRLGADCRDVDHAPDGGLRAGVEQRAGRLDMDAAGVVARRRPAARRRNSPPRRRPASCGRQASALVRRVKSASIHRA